MAVVVKPLTAARAEAAFALATEVFVAGSTVHRALGVGLEAYRAHLRPSFDAMAGEGLSVVAVESDTSAVVGCLVATDFARQFDAGHAPDGPLAPLAALTAALAGAYARVRGVPAPGQVVLVDMAAVAPTGRGQGVYLRMRQAAQALAREKGYSRVVGELSSAATQHVVRDVLGHSVVAEVRFADFLWRGERPFAGIVAPKSIVLTEGLLGPGEGRRCLSSTGLVP